MVHHSSLPQSIHPPNPNKMSGIGRIPLRLLSSVNHLLLLITLVSATPNYLYTYCPDSNTTLSSAYRSNINALLSTLSASANGSSTPGFHYTTSSVNGLYLCRGDLDPATCRDCVAAASTDLPQKCPSGTQAVIWYDECKVRYSNTSFFAHLDDGFNLQLMNTQNVTLNVTGFNQVLSTTLSKVATEAAQGGDTKKFKMEQAKFNDFQTLYTLGQCTPDLSSSDCYQCLQQGFSILSSGYKQGWRVMFFSCTLHYEIYQFYQTNSQILPMYTYCPPSSFAYRSNIDALLSELSSAASRLSPLGFYNDTIGGNTPAAVFGLYLCRGDITPAACRDCVAAASAYLPQNCRLGNQAVVLYELCMVRYSNESFFGELDTSLDHTWKLVTQIFVNNAINTFKIGYVLGQKIETLKSKASEKRENGKMFGTVNVTISDNSTLYMLGQCTPDLSSDDCSICLQKCADTIQTYSYPTAAMVYFFSCNLRFALSQFYSDSEGNSTDPFPGEGGTPSPGPKPKRRRLHFIITGSVVIATVLLFLGLALWVYVSKRNKRATSKGDLKDIVTAESLQMDLTTIRAATHNFAIDRKLGQGGFGAVYKGTLGNGQDIAAKRLSDNSGQGIVEFKTEVLLVAKLQHRNLVKLLGFCASGVENILVYEYLPNSSLDKIIFDLTKRMSLNWETRFKIICGIAKGLMYLHEDSRLRVIHRDLKASNILLDEDMNPKISDFGLAKLFRIDQTQDMTDSVAGTYGYMAPEYILMGHYSIKSDVYSFGIIVLEVVSGLRNKYKSHPLLEEALLYRAWRFWNEGEALKLVDEALGDNYSREEVIKCIHIGLLCIQERVASRPNMTSVVASLGGQSITLPLPTPPNFFDSSDPSSTINTSSSGVCSGQAVSIRETSEITELHGR